MPKYRNIHTKTPDSEDINDMPDDFTRFFYVMFFIILDSEGRGYDKASWLKSKAFPLREDVTNEMIEAAMNWFEQRKMIYRYEAGGKKCFYDPKFKEHQSGLNRESASVIPAPDPALLASWSGVTLEQVTTNSDPVLVRNSAPALTTYSAPKTKTTTNSKTNTDTKTNSNTTLSRAREGEPSLSEMALPAPEADFESAELSSEPKPLPRERQLRLWNLATGELQKMLPKVEFDTWVRPLKAGGMDGNRFKVLAVNSASRDFVMARAGPLEKALSGYAGFQVDLVIEVGG